MNHFLLKYINLSNAIQIAYKPFTLNEGWLYIYKYNSSNNKKQQIERMYRTSCQQILDIQGQ